MKYRSGFVSNSSSSSFIVIGTGSGSAAYDELKTCVSGDTFYGQPKRGITEFGWQEETYTDVWSRLNFCWIQILSDVKHLEKEKREWMLKEVLKEELGVKNVYHGFSWDEFGLKDAYIDHASASREGENVEMFASKEALIKFIFCEDSKIVNDNDNH